MVLYLAFPFVIVLKEEVTAKIDVCTQWSCGVHVFIENAPWPHQTVHVKIKLHFYVYLNNLFSFSLSCRSAHSNVH